MGRPDGKVVKELCMKPVAAHLSKVLKKPVKYIDECIGEKVEKAVKNLKKGEILFLENVRFYPGEEKNDASFAKQLAKFAEVYVSDSFATAHRAHATTVEVSKYLPAYAGLLMQKEIENLSELIHDTKHPLTVIIAGAKIDTKIGIIENFIAKADNFIIGGGLANTFLSASGFNVGKSLYEPGKLDVAQKTMLKAESFHKNFVLPEDVIVADEISDKAATLDIPAEDVIGEMKILDIGSKSIKKFIEIINKSKTVVWNGPVGLSEMKPFAKGTAAIAKALATNKKVKSILGGGDTIDAVKRMGYKESQFGFVSTGGGAMLEFLEGKKLPGVEILLGKGTEQKGKTPKAKATPKKAKNSKKPAKKATQKKKISKKKAMAEFKIVR